MAEVLPPSIHPKIASSSLPVAPFSAAMVAVPLYEGLDRSFEQVILRAERMGISTGLPPFRSESNGFAMQREPGGCFLAVEKGRGAVSPSTVIRSRLCRRGAQIRRTLLAVPPKSR